MDTATTYIKPTLAKNLTTQDPAGMLMSEKLDGVRAIWDGARFISRNGRIFNAPSHFTNGMPDCKLDGELFLGRGRFSEGCGMVRRDSDQWEGMEYVIFDLVAHDITATYRQAALRKLQLPAHCRVLHQVICEGGLHLEQFAAKIAKLKGEGVMLREAGSYYTHGRTSDLLKVKTMTDGEAVVTDYVAGKGKHAGRMGALWCDYNGVECKVGTGFTDEQRDNPPAIGDVITVQFFEITAAGKPRFPVFIGIRNYE